MVWPDMTFEPETRHPLGHDRPADEVAFDDDLFAYYRERIALRNGHAPLRRGDFEVLFADDATRTMAFRRALPADTMIVVLNRSRQDAALMIPAHDPDLYETLFETGARPVGRALPEPAVRSRSTCRLSVGRCFESRRSRDSGSAGHIARCRCAFARSAAVRQDDRVRIRIWHQKDGGERPFFERAVAEYNAAHPDRRRSALSRDRGAA
jgi:hypothetical protein